MHGQRWYLFLSELRYSARIFFIDAANAHSLQCQNVSNTEKTENLMSTVIKVENLSKKYILSHQSQERYTALRDVMANGLKNLGKKLLSPLSPHLVTRNSQPELEDFYALNDVSFEINQGDRVGIIGRNGAGKSTLLKILSRITEPTSGRIEISGRVASLLEVGTGFHPELTGRENIFLNGAILGMGKAEIKRKFDEIVNFAEVERFLDTPVKRYSSGMYVRLAFAVAAHLEPEILIVDEVLAVGDSQFQKKCLGKMEEVAVNEGRTVLFVSHQMGTIDALCNKGILLSNGKIIMEGNAKEVTNKYLVGDDGCLSNTFHSNQHLDFKFESAGIRDFAGNPTSWVDQIDDFLVELTFNVNKKITKTHIGLSLFKESVNQPIISTVIADSEKYENCQDYEVGYYKAIFHMRGGVLLPGTYYLNIYCHSPSREHYDKRDNVQSLDIKRSEHFDIARYSDSISGIVSAAATWDLIRMEG